MCEQAELHHTQLPRAVRVVQFSSFAPRAMDPINQNFNECRTVLPKGGGGARTSHGATRGVFLLVVVAPRQPRAAVRWVGVRLQVCVVLPEALRAIAAARLVRRFPLGACGNRRP